MASTVTKQDPRYPVLRRGKNARFPRADTDAVARIEVCESPEDAADALQHALNAGIRPTIRSGGHCYEDFVVNNPNGAILDVSLLNQVSSVKGGGYHIGPGAVLGAVYTDLYRQSNVTIPGGSCYSVAAGGHISGGGYGLLTRLQGLTIDLLTAVDILTVEANGKVIPRHVDSKHDSDLFRALRGSGGASYGVVTAFYFDRLPTAPRNLSSASVSFPWDTMSEDQFIHIAQTYGEYFETRGRDPDTWPMFTFMGLTHKSPGGRIGISATWHDMDGTNDLSVPTEFLDRFMKCGVPSSDPNPATASHQPGNERGRGRDQSPCIAGQHRYNITPWLDATIGGGGGAGANGNTRGKYKSCYMKKNFTTAELKRMFAQLTRDIPGIDTSCIIAVDSYGGAVNKPELADKTSVSQRGSIMKLQHQMYWSDPKEDEARLKYFDELYTDIYTPNVPAPHSGTPFHGEFYEGCYINYPDADMTKYAFWPELYYGTKGLYPFLQAVKKKYDPNNIFHHSMTVRA